MCPGRGAAAQRLLNHADHSVTGVYDRHHYGDVDRRIVDAVAAHVDAIVNGTSTDNVVRLR
jgi:hypothetical protein